MNAYQYVAVNEYGACLMDTLGFTPEESETKFKDSFKRVSAELGCCIVQLVPVPVLGKPQGYWLSKDREYKKPCPA